MKIAFFNTNKSWGGGEKWHLDTAIHLISRNHNITLFACKDSELHKRAKQAGVHVCGCHVTNLSFLNPFKIFIISRLFKKLNVDAVILNLSTDVKLAGIAAKIAGIKKIVYRRGLPVPVSDNMLNRFLFRRILTHIIANSLEIKKRILAKNPQLVQENKITVIYNGIDPPAGTEHQPDHNLTKDTHGIIIGSAGRLSEEKRQEYLIDMARLLLRKDLDFSVLVAGDGNMLQSLKNKVKQLGLEQHVFFPGFVTNMTGFYNSIDIFALTSSWEGCSNAILEAMQHGLPVVAFNNSSLPEIIENDVNGFLAENENVEDLADKMELLIRNDHLRKRIGIVAMQRMSNKFNKQKNIDLLEQLLMQ